MAVSTHLTGPNMAHLKSALDEAAIVAITDKFGVITYANNKFCAISKYPIEELIGKNHRIINSQYHTKDFFEKMWSTISKGKVWEGEIRNRAKDGSLYWVHTTIVPFLDSLGTPEQYVSVRYDITERKLAEEQLKVYAKKLEISNKELQDFASVAAHDLQEPLRKIQAFSERLTSKAKNLLDAETFDYVNRIQNSAKRMQTLINDLLTYSRVTTKSQPFSQVDLNVIITQVLSELEISLENAHGKVNVLNLEKIYADQTQISQLFQNLIGNAIKFRKPDTYPIIEISGQLLDSSALGAQAYEITVTDNGIGFDEKYLDRIFTIFQRLHGRHEYEGTGIGLAVCRKIVDRHGGLLTAKSTPGNGAQFIITLPVQPNNGEQL